VIMAEEVHAFEDENDIIRRVAAGPGVSTSYDWEGMNIALIRHPGAQFRLGDGRDE
jgi:hypothetical protein